jgi:putative oxidoreductase
MTNQASPRMFAATDELATRSSDAILLVARLLIGWLFLTNSWAKIVNMQGFVSYLTNLRVPSPSFWAWPAMVAEVLLGITLILGIATRYASLFAFVYLIIAIALAHRYWEYPAAQMINQYNHFYKNLAICIGAVPNRGWSLLSRQLDAQSLKTACAYRDV